MAIVIIRYTQDTKKYGTGISLYIMIAVIMPILCMGYNPYTALDAKRASFFSEYAWAKDGVLLVQGENGYGLRDRYKMILPAEYDRIEVLTPSKPYCKVCKNKMWQIYDIERHELVSEEWFTEITPCEELIYRLRWKNGEKYLYIPKLYNRYKERPQAVITSELIHPNLALNLQ